MGLMTRKYGVIILLLLLVSGILGVWVAYRPDAGSGEIRNVLLVSIDTCRADHLSCYGYESATTPNIDALAGEGILFENVISPIPQTLPAHSTMMTGTIPPYHGVHENVGGYLDDELNLTLAEILKGAGFATAAAISAFPLDSQFGIAQGFDDYYDHFENPEEGERGQERKAEETTGDALEWLDQNKDKKFFFFLHYYDPHMKYAPPEPFASQFADDAYAGEVAYTDHNIGKILDKLKELKLYESTLIIITGDHGEMLGEHGELGHTYFIYQGAIKVPLIFKLPGQNKAVRIKPIAGLVDIVPTVCGLLGIETPKNVQGVDLFVDSKGEDLSGQGRNIYCESFTPTRYKASSLLGVVNNRYKYIQATRPELYDLVEDPGETNNLAKVQNKRARIMKDKLVQILEQSVRETSGGGEMIDPETRQKLETLGYTGGTASQNFDIAQMEKDPKDDPKDLLDYHFILEQLLVSFGNKDYEKMEMCAAQMAELRPDLTTPYEKLGVIAMRQKEYSKALVNFQKMIEIEPDNDWAKQKVGVMHLKLRNYEQAIEAFGVIIRERKQDPDSRPKSVAVAYSDRGMAYINMQDYDRAIEDFNQVLKLDPTHAQSFNNRGTAYVYKGNYDLGIRDFNKAIELDPKLAAAYHSRGAAYARQGKFEQARPDFDIAIELAPEDINAYNSRGLTLKNMGEDYLAIRDFSKIIELDPEFFSAYNQRGMAYTKRGELSRAIADFSEVIRLRPNWPDAYQNRGVAYLSNNAVSKRPNKRFKNSGYF